MIELKQAPHPSEPDVIELKSNLSMSLDRLAAVFAGLCALTFAVVAWPVVLGLWPILLAALLHLAVVGWCFRTAWRGNWVRERLEISAERLVIEHFRLGHRSRSEWPLAWARVQRGEGRFADLHVYVSSQGKRQEIGAFLPVNERAELARMLENALWPRTAWRRG